MNSEILPGKAYPLGATAFPTGVNFSIFSQTSTALELLLFDDPNASKPDRVIQLDPKRNKTLYYWHVFVPGIGAGQIYAFRAYGAFAPEQGHRFDSTKVLLDPYARVVVGDENYSREAASLPGDNCAQALKGVVVDCSVYDWEGDTPPRTPYTKTIIYELHVGGFTRNPNSGVSPDKRGTYAGLVEKIPYLKELGVTAVELQPVHQFDEQDARLGVKNYWGYSTIAFFAPHRAYSYRRDPFGPVDEFRDMVKALHRAGIEVILDVVFNHTAEGDHNGPTLSFKGLENRAYYILERNMALYSNYSGCGNSLRANHPVMARLIIDSLQYWVAEMHVDGFRFDLASALSRDLHGVSLERPPVLWAIETDPILVETKMIVEAWDAAGLYQVGWFVESSAHVSEWNGPFRDDVRRFVKGDPGMVSRLADRILGSPDIYTRLDYQPHRSINFVTCHDGFTLNDLVSYNQKHNEANLEDSRDGANDNFSWNCGEEGPTHDSAIEALRLQQIKNFLTILFVSQGTPMMLMGDEVRRSQLGNNNAYCQNNELSWFDWSGLEKNSDYLHFVKGLIDFTQSLEIFQQQKLLEVTYGSWKPHIVWHGVSLGKPDWGHDSHSLAFTLRCPSHAEHLHVMLNAYWEPLTFEVPPLGDGEIWHRIVDTALPTPEDFCDRQAAPIIEGDTYRTQAHSSVVLMALSKEAGGAGEAGGAREDYA